MTRCGQCVYWEPPKDGSDSRMGECRSSPPLHEYWPVTLPEDWCGQARAREPEPEAQSVVEEASAVVEMWWRIGRTEADMQAVIADLEKALERVKP